MPDYSEIYQHHADQYDLLVEREDYQHNLPRALHQIDPFDYLDVVEFGAGTGRLTCMLAPLVKTMRAFDNSRHMLDLAERKLSQTGLNNWQVGLGDHRKIEAGSGSADAVLSGWSIVYLVVDHPETWQLELQQGLTEMRRVARPKGKIVIIETLGTGHETPDPPAEMRAYLNSLVAFGFQQTWIRTDYLFQDTKEAEMLIRFFFGEDMIEKLQPDDGRVLLPECTGIWWQTNDQIKLPGTPH